MSWGEFIAAVPVFFLSHSVPLRPQIRAWLLAWSGPRGFTLSYGALSLAALAWVIGAAGRAPVVPVWDRAAWQPHVTLICMLAACVILGLAIARPNPFSFGGARTDRFDPARAGIVRYMRHPLLVALALWATGHLVVNGDLAHVILFGSFAGFALLGGRLVDRRRRRQMGADWARLHSAVQARSWWRPRPASRREALVRVGLGAVLYGGLVALHPWLFGVAPLG